MLETNKSFYESVDEERMYKVNQRGIQKITGFSWFLCRVRKYRRIIRNCWDMQLMIKDLGRDDWAKK